MVLRIPESMCVPCVSGSSSSYLPVCLCRRPPVGLLYINEVIKLTNKERCRSQQLCRYSTINTGLLERVYYSCVRHHSCVSRLVHLRLLSVPYTNGWCDIPPNTCSTTSSLRPIATTLKTRANANYLRMIASR